MAYGYEVVKCDGLKPKPTRRHHFVEIIHFIVFFTGEIGKHHSLQLDYFLGIPWFCQIHVKLLKDTFW